MSTLKTKVGVRMKSTFFRAPDALGMFRPLAAGFAVAGVLLLAWPGLTPAGIIYAGVGALVANAFGNGLKALTVFIIGAAIVNAAVVPLATSGPDFASNPFEDLAAPSITVETDQS